MSRAEWNIMRLYSEIIKYKPCGTRIEKIQLNLSMLARRYLLTICGEIKIAQWIKFSPIRKLNLSINIYDLVSFNVNLCRLSDSKILLR